MLWLESGRMALSKTLFSSNDSSGKTRAGPQGSPRRQSLGGRVFEPLRIPAHSAPPRNDADNETELRVVNPRPMEYTKTTLGSQAAHELENTSGCGQTICNSRAKVLCRRKREKRQGVGFMIRSPQSPKGPHRKISTLGSYFVPSIMTGQESCRIQFMG